MVTWHFQIENSRDVAFATSKAFIWDMRQKINLPSGKTILAQSRLPAENLMEWMAWTQINWIYQGFNWALSRDHVWVPYASANQCGSGYRGMEYPRIEFFLLLTSKRRGTLELTDHEFWATNWFPMIVGNQNERRYAWMDGVSIPFIKSL